MSNQIHTRPKYDLEERTSKFGERVILLVKNLPRNGITQRLIPQLVGSATSVGANYMEADCSESKKDFIHKMAIANKEAKESKHFLRMIMSACEESKNEVATLLQEAHELNLIFTTIIKNTREKL